MFGFWRWGSELNNKRSYNRKENVGVYQFHMHLGTLNIHYK